MESRLLGFPYSVISIACFGNAFHTIAITTKALFGTGTTCKRWRLFAQVDWLRKVPRVYRASFRQEYMFSRGATGRLSQSLRRADDDQQGGVGPLRDSKFGLTPCEPLLISQGHNGVRLRRAPCRNVAGEQRDSSQDQRNDDERQRVGGLDAIQQAGQEAGQN